MSDAEYMGERSWERRDRLEREAHEKRLGANEYQIAVARTLLYERNLELDNHETLVSWDAMGLAGETGEVCDLVKKGIYHRRGLDRERIADELRDVLWYVAAAALASHLGLTMEEVMQKNLDKLAARFAAGYTAEEANAKRDKNGGGND